MAKIIAWMNENETLRSSNPVLGKSNRRSWQSVVLKPFYAMVEALTYYSFPKILLTMIGLWPYQTTRFTVLKNSFISLNLFLFIVAQVLARGNSLNPHGDFKILTLIAMCLVFITREFMLKYVSFVLMSLGSFARYNINWYQLPAMKKLMDKIKRDMEMGHDEALEILKKHAYMAKIYGLRFGCERF
ncbi:hypothetical protein WN51_05511 [Melipona quadrifasciata]|uniref:Uncharacterized protein n=1 Tax=Melipona quadrifasciata TaxID=166423 RepID=A0A0M9ABV6_9HYME|nr:hypothetical protein WN51_05511 [Melipona quadrifasciata]